MEFWKTARLYIITRRDLIPGLQTAQSVHGIVEFFLKHPFLAIFWRLISNYICVLSVSDELELNNLMYSAKRCKIKTASFYEPDLDLALTAVVLAPGKKSANFCQHLPLALSEYLC